MRATTELFDLRTRPRP